MKHFYLLFTFLLLLATPVSQGANTPQEQSIKKNEVPKVIMDAFLKAYPKAKIKGFSKETHEGKLTYEIESSEAQIHRDVTYNPDGSLVSVEETLPASELPEAVRSTLSKEFPKARILKSEKLTKGQTIEYELLLEVGKESFEVVFDPDGKIVKKEVVKEKEE